MKSWGKHFLLLTLLFILLFGAVVYRGQQAINGITWGWIDVICTVNTSYCSIDVKTLPVKLGLYDNVGNFSDSENFAVDHYFISWSNFDRTKLLQDIKKSNSRNRWPLISVEPWNKEHPSRETILADVVKGSYDDQILEVCSILKEYNQPSFIRFGHEMEKVTGRYPWAVQDANSYIEAYRYFVTKCKEVYSQGYYVWSPVGDRGLENYYPGENFVDYVGFSVYGLDSFDKDNYGHVRSFSEIVNEKYERVKHYKKPVMIAELGVSGTDSYQKKWLKEGLENADRFSLLKLVICFNSKDNVGAWGEQYGIPNWSIDRTVFN